MEPIVVDSSLRPADHFRIAFALVLRNPASLGLFVCGPLLWALGVASGSVAVIDLGERVSWLVLLVPAFAPGRVVHRLPSRVLGALREGAVDVRRRRGGHRAAAATRARRVERVLEVASGGGLLPAADDRQELRGRGSPGRRRSATRGLGSAADRASGREAWLTAGRTPRSVLSEERVAAARMARTRRAPQSRPRRRRGPRGT
jgi:hypothetical protein